MKIHEKSLPGITFYKIDETLILDDPTMVLLDFPLPRNFKIHGKALITSLLKKHIQKSLQNLVGNYFLRKNSEF